MTLNGIKIKKYRAKVKARNLYTTANEPIDENGYKVVEGYVSISEINLPDGSNEPQYIPIFVAEEVDISRVAMSGFGSTTFYPTSYYLPDFEILGEVKE